MTIQVMEDFIVANPTATWDNWVNTIDRLIAGIPQDMALRTSKQARQLTKLQSLKTIRSEWDVYVQRPTPPLIEGATKKRKAAALFDASLTDTSSMTDGGGPSKSERTINSLEARDIEALFDALVTETDGGGPTESETTTDSPEARGVAGLTEVLKGKSIVLRDDVKIAKVNCSELVRLVLRDILLDGQKVPNQRKFSDSDPMKRIIWEAVSAPAPPHVHNAAYVFEEAKLKEEECEDALPDFPDLKPDEVRCLEQLFPHIGADSPPPENEASYTYKYVTPHFNRLCRRRWKFLIDTTLVDRKRPDIRLEAYGRVIVVVEVKSPHARESQQNFQLGEGLERAMQFLKEDFKSHDWGETPPQLLTAISSDGVVFHVYNIQIIRSLCLCVELGKIPIVNSLENVANLPRCLAGFNRLREILHERAKVAGGQISRNPFQPAPACPATPDKSGLMRDLRKVYPDAVSPEKAEKRRRSKTIIEGREGRS
ncbi:hypothetical protein HK104_005069 [Borealophlyctis nickersoniae]|nr:hypothetical protein HK104_005069 [Borealophlyctis nickersoniae]